MEREKKTEYRRHMPDDDDDDASDAEIVSYRLDVDTRI